MAGELEDAELAALARHWLLYDLAELGEFEQARQRHVELERIAAELQQPLYRHSALAWRAVWRARGSVRRGRAAGPRLAAPRGRRRCPGRADALHSAIGRDTARAGPSSTSSCRRSNGWPAVMPTRPSGGASCHSPISTPAIALEPARRSVTPSTARRRLPRTMLWLTATGSLCEAAARARGRRRRRASVRGTRAVRGPAGPMELHRKRRLRPTLLGRAAAVTGRMDAARDHYEAGLARHTELEAPALLARTRCDYGEFLLHTHSPGRIDSCSRRPRPQEASA